jgi:uncharacterized protein YjiS (DUF1127 family)
MNGTTMRSAFDPCFDPASLRARPAEDLWRLWLRVGRELLLRAAPPLAIWRARAQERRMLAYMIERDFRDIGITPQQAKWEMNKPFWKP